MVFEAGERPDLAAAALRAARKVPELSETPTIVALPPRQITSFDPASGFDDFIVVPCVPAELYARIRALEWRRSEFATEERLKIGALVVDRAAHEVSVEGRRVTLTAKEFALLAFLAANRGRVFSRETLLARVWGSRYEGGARTVDIHVRRLRAKLGDALPLETLRGAGYKLRAPSDAGKSSVTSRGARARVVRAIAVSVGCPCGVGPEVSVVAAAAERRARVLLVGDDGRDPRCRARAAGVAAQRLVRVSEPATRRGPSRAGPSASGSPTATSRRATAGPARRRRASGAAQLAWIDAACDLVAERPGRRARDRAREQGGHRPLGARQAPPRFLGHTEHLQRRLRAREVVMAFWSPELATSLVTTHLPLARVPARRHARRGSRAPRTGSPGSSRARARRAPRIAVASLNPHAGEGGLLGREERTRIVPGIARARARLRASGIRGDARRPRPRRDRLSPRAAGAGRRGGGTASSRCTTTRRPSR